MSPGDRISELYKGLASDSFSAEAHATARDRIHWICQRVEGPKVVDIGCSQGIASILLARDGFEVLGVDTDADAIEYANNDRAQEPPAVQQRLTFVRGDLYDADLPERAFHTAIMGEFLEHQVRPDKALSRAYELLADDGKLIITVPFGLLTDPDHKQTFYIGSLYRLLHSHFRISEVEIVGRYLCVACRRREKALEAEADRIDLGLVERAEQEFLQRETALTKDGDARKKQAEKLKAELNTARSELSTARSELSTARSELSTARSELSTARSEGSAARREATRLKAELAKEKRTVQAMRKSISFQLGNMLILAVRRPGRNTVLLPYRIVRLAVRISRRRTHHSTSEIAGKRGYALEAVGREVSTVRQKASSTRTATTLAPPDTYTPTKDSVFCLLSNSLPYATGGYAIRSHGLLSALTADGWQMHGVTRLGFPFDVRAKRGLNVPRIAPDEAVPDRDVIDSVPYCRLLDGNLNLTTLKTETYLHTYLENALTLCIKYRPALIHGASNYLNGIVATRLAHILGLPSIYEVRGLWELTPASVDPNYANTKAYHNYVRREMEVCNQASAIIAITQGVKGLLVDRGAPNHKIVVVPNGVDTERFLPASRDRELEGRLGYGGKMVIGYIGAFAVYEGLEYLLQAVSILLRRGWDDFRVLLVGDGPKFDELQALCDELHLREVVTLIGRVPHAEIERYYSLVDIVALPRIGAQVCEIISPLKPFEAMSMGKAVVASNVAALAEIVRDGETGLLHKKDDADHLAHRLETLLNNPELTRSLGEAARKWVVANRDWSVLARDVGDLYRTLLEPRNQLHLSTPPASMQSVERNTEDHKTDNQEYPRKLPLQYEHGQKYDSLADSVTFRAGEALVRAVTSPKGAIAFPFRLWRIYRDHRLKESRQPQTEPAPSEKRAPKLYEPTTASVSGPVILPTTRHSRTQAARVLFMPTNGGGLGHVTRLLAIARRLKNETRVTEMIFLTTSQALSVLCQEGFVSYHHPTIDQLRDKISTLGRQSSFRGLLDSVVNNHGINVLVFDGVSAAGVAPAIRRYESMSTVWIRRMSLKEGKEEMFNRHAEFFDVQVVPGELGQKSVAQDSAGRIIVPPMVFLEQSELLSRKTVIDQLGLDPAKKTVFVQLGAGNINDINTQSETIIETARQFADVQLVLAESPISHARLEWFEGVRTVRDYPLSRYYQGFDVVISAAGYNTVTELAYFGIPSILIPNLQTRADDQLGRARIAQQAGAALLLSPLTASGLTECLETLLDDTTNAEFRTKCLGLYSVNGSDVAAEVLADFLFEL